MVYINDKLLLYQVSQFGVITQRFQNRCPEKTFLNNNRPNSADSRVWVCTRYELIGEAYLSIGQLIESDGYDKYSIEW